MKISVIGNCQTNNLTACMQIMAPLADISGTVVDYATALPADISDSDLIFLQTSQSEIPYENDILAKRFSDRIRWWPNIYYSGYHPDLYFIYRPEGGAYQSALGDYSSAIVVYAWLKGLSPSAAKDLFCEPIYDHLGYFDHLAVSDEMVASEGEKCSLDLVRMLPSWKSGGCFMHSPSHPKLFVEAQIARALLESCGIPVMFEEPERFLQDWVLNWASWPVYPGLAHKLGIHGRYEFKLPKNMCEQNRPAEVIDLEEFIKRSYKFYDLYPREHMKLPPHMEESFANLPVPAKKTKSRKTPYSDLPTYQFWRNAVSASVAGDFDPVVSPKFKIERQQKIASCGSCFAQHIANALISQGYNYLVTEEAPNTSASDPEGADAAGQYSAQFGNIYTARQLLQLFERAYGRRIPNDTAWQRDDGRYIDPFRPQIPPAGFETPEQVALARTPHLEAVRRMFEESDILIFTVGLTEAWRAKADGTVFPVAPGVVAQGLDQEDYEFVNLRVADIADDLSEFCSRIRLVNRSVKLLLTVSPVPLVATFENKNAVVATTYSKSALRAAVDDVVREMDFVEYFPSFEIITNWYNKGRYFEDDLRSVTAEGVDHVMRVFGKSFLKNAPQENVASSTPLPQGRKLAGLRAQIIRAMKFICDDELLDRDRP